MKWMTAALLAAFFLFAPLSAIAEDDVSNHATEVLNLRNVEAYHWKANTLEGEWRGLEYREQWVVSELIDICYELAETKGALADAGSAGDRDRKKLLENQYLDLKAEEAELWDELARLNK